MRSTSRFYDRDTWVDRDGLERMMTAYTVFPDDFQEKMAKETRLDIGEYDTHYILQVLVEFRTHPTEARMEAVRDRLLKFVDRHFKPFVDDVKAN